MFVDARPFKAKLSPVLLSKKYHEKIATKRQIAKAYFAGADLKELAEEYGLSIQKIMAIANWYDREKTTARRLAKVMAEMRVEPEPVELTQAVEDVERPGTYVMEIMDKRNLNGQVYHKVTLPLLSIQRRKA